MVKNGNITHETPQPSCACRGRCPQQKRAGDEYLTDKEAAELADDAAGRVADAVADAAKGPQ